MTDPVETRSAEVADAAAISALHGRVFGPGRFARSAYRIREGTRGNGVSPLCRVATNGGRLIAAVTLTDVAVGGVAGAVLLGPVTVDPDFAGRGIGRRLIAEGIEAARAADRTLVVLVGDEPYYGRFGFTRVPPGQIALPGPVNPMRLLGLSLTDGALASARGLITPV